MIKNMSLKTPQQSLFWPKRGTVFFFFSMITSSILTENKAFLKTVKQTYEMDVDLKKNNIMEIVVVCLV